MYDRDRVVQLCPPARPYIKKSFEGISMYDLAGDYINKFCNYEDPMYDYIVYHPRLSDSYVVNPFIHYCDHVVAKFNACVISKYGI